MMRALMIFGLKKKTLSRRIRHPQEARPQNLTTMRATMMFWHGHFDSSLPRIEQRGLRQGRQQLRRWSPGIKALQNSYQNPLDSLILLTSSKEFPTIIILLYYSEETSISKGKAGGKAGVAKNTRSSTRRRILVPRRDDDDEDFVMSDRE